MAVRGKRGLILPSKSAQHSLHPPSLPAHKTLSQVSVNGQVSPELLVNYVYRLYGLDADELDVDFFSFTGNALQMGSPRLAQVSYEHPVGVHCTLPPILCFQGGGERQG